MRGLRSILTVSAGCRLMRHRAIILTRLRCSRWSACRIRCAKLPIDEDRSGAEQVVEPSGTGGSEQSKPLTVVKNVAAVEFCIAGTVILLFVQRLWGRNVKESWKMRLKLRYACLLAAK